MSLHCFRNHTRSYVALVQFYMALQDYVQEEIWRSSSLNGPSCVPEGAYTELCAKFFAIFLLMLRYIYVSFFIVGGKNPLYSMLDLHIHASNQSILTLLIDV